MYKGIKELDIFCWHLSVQFEKYNKICIVFCDKASSVFQKSIKKAGH